MSKTRFSGVLGKVRKGDSAPQESESPAPSPSKIGRPRGKKSDPDYRQVTVYLREEVHRAAKKRLLDQDKQFSELVDELVDQWVKSESLDS